MRLRNAFRNSVFEASKLVSTKTLLLKHYYRHQGMFFFPSFPLNTSFLENTKPPFCPWRHVSFQSWKHLWCIHFSFRQMMTCLFNSFRVTEKGVEFLVAQCSATPATVPATPPCSATPFQTQISVQHLPGMGGGEGAIPIFLGGVARHRCYTFKTL